MRLGYVILPSHPGPLEQAMVAEFIARGYFVIHVGRMRKLYRDRQSKMVSVLMRHLPARIDVNPAGAGIKLI